MWQTTVQHDVATKDFSGTMDGVAKKRASQGVSVAISPEVSSALTEWAESRLHDKKATVTRIVAWFLRQSTPVQDGVLGRPSGELAPQLAMALRKLADEIEANPGTPSSGAKGSGPRVAETGADAALRRRALRGAAKQ